MHERVLIVAQQSLLAHIVSDSLSLFLRSALSSLLNSSTPPYALVMYTATWCGPCNRVKPIIQQKVSSDWSKFSASCTFSYLYEDGEGVDVASYGVSAFPTFRLYKTGSGDPKDCLGEVKGGDVEGVQRLLEEVRVV